MPGTPLPTVAIVGRPNVGKSTLFNRLVGKRRAITSPVAGTTRDRITEEASWNGRAFRLMDTGGLDIPDPENVIEQHVVRHAEQAIASANLLLFVVDASQPLGLLDRRAADRLRRATVPVLLVANKAERLTEADVSELYSLGLGEPMLVSSMVGTGTGDLLDALVARLDAPREGERERHPRIALVGRPNVGKSSLLNAITGEERAIVSNIPGTTRDAVDTELVFQGAPLTLLDTAGIRRRGKLDTALEYYSVDRAQRAIEGADVAVLVLDAHEQIAHQDQVITSVAIEAGVGLVIAANKSDLLSDEDAARERILRALHREFVFLPWAPVVFTSATEGQNIDALLEVALQCATARSTFVDQEDLASYIRRATLAKPPPLHGGKAVKITALQQTGIRPPTFAVTIRGTAELHFSYRRFLERLIRERYGFQGTPIRLHFHAEKR